MDANEIKRIRRAGEVLGLESSFSNIAWKAKTCAEDLHKNASALFAWHYERIGELEQHVKALRSLAEALADIKKEQAQDANKQ